MIAGAPGACGSLAIFSSSGEIGWKPSPALTVPGRYAAKARRVTSANQEAPKRGRRDTAAHLNNLYATDQYSGAAGRSRELQPPGITPDTRSSASQPFWRPVFSNYNREPVDPARIA